MSDVAPFKYTRLLRAAEYNVRAELDVLADTREAALAFVERRARSSAGGDRGLHRGEARGATLHAYWVVGRHRAHSRSVRAT